MTNALGHALLARDFRLYELINAGMNISLAVLIDGKLKATEVESAIHRAGLIHPYLRMRIAHAKGSAFGFRFEEIAAPAISLRVDTGDVTGTSWQARLNAVGNEPASTAGSVSRWWLVSSPDKLHHQLIWTINHGSTDGIGIFSILDDLLDELGMLAIGNDRRARAPREFVDILSRVPAEALKYPPPDIPAHCMPAIRSPGNVYPSTPARILGTWHEFDTDSTMRLIEASRQNGCTIQGMLCAATIVAICQAQAAEHPLPQDISILAPVNMRPYVNPPVDRKDSTCGSAGLTWYQHVDRKTPIWELARGSTDGLAKALEEKQGLWWWATLSAGKPVPAPTVMCSSIGVTPIKKNYGGIMIRGVKLLGGAYDKATAGSAGIMTHAYTFDGRLNITFAYTNPPLSPSWASQFLGTEIHVLEKLASDESHECNVESMLEIPP